jgi:hypothetical protein
MTITVENDNDVVVHSLEKVISYTRRSQQIFVAQCVWWLASMIGLQQGLIIHIDNIQSRIEVGRQTTRTGVAWEPQEVSSTPRDTQEDPRRNFGTGNIQPD